MDLTPEQSRKLREYRLKQISPDAARASSRASQALKKSHHHHVKLALKRAGYDTPRNPDPRKILRETCKIVPAGSEVEKILRETQKIQFRSDDFLSYVQAVLDRAEKKGLLLFFFSLKGFSSYPFVHCASLTYYGARTEDFYQALDEFIANNANMYYEATSYRPITDKLELTRIFETFGESDKETFRRVAMDILAKAPHYRAIDFIGHNRTIPVPQPPPPRPAI